MARCAFIPPYLLQRIAESGLDEETRRCGADTLTDDADLRGRRLRPPPRIGGEPEVPVPPVGEDAWTVHTADNGSALPGDPVRSEGEPPSGDVAVDEAYDAAEATLALFSSVFERDSFDGQGAPVVATVHYQRRYNNAFWDGRQLVFGDGDGRIFERFTKPIDVLGHEFTHAVVQYTAALAYQDQPGALNESVSDVFASLLKQRVLGQTAEEADWLIGEGIFTPAVDGRALRSMSAPGTAYDDPAIGKDPQVASMADYVHTSDDNGGVHLNSGIPNRAFHLAATTLGGHSWEQAGPIWYAALTSAGVGETTDFAGFARATVEAAREGYGDDVAVVVADAWDTVGVVAEDGAPAADEAPAGDMVSVVRSGGFAGISASGQVDLTGDPRADEARRLVERIDLAAVHATSPQPDRFSYRFVVGGQEVTVAEQDLTDDLSALADLVLGEQ